MSVPSSRLDSIGTPIPCASAAEPPRSTDMSLRAFHLFFIARVGRAGGVLSRRGRSQQYRRRRHRSAYRGDRGWCRSRAARRWRSTARRFSARRGGCDSCDGRLHRALATARGAPRWRSRVRSASATATRRWRMAHQHGHLLHARRRRLRAGRVRVVFHLSDPPREPRRANGAVDAARQPSEGTAQC